VKTREEILDWLSELERVIDMGIEALDASTSRIEALEAEIKRLHDAAQPIAATPTDSDHVDDIAHIDVWQRGFDAGLRAKAATPQELEGQLREAMEMLHKAQLKSIHRATEIVALKNENEWLRGNAQASPVPSTQCDDKDLRELNEEIERMRAAVTSPHRETP
jgi:hypothetical protein